MAYRPKRPTGAVDATYIYEELLKISQSLQVPNFEVLQLPALTEAPAKPRDGMVAHADGTNWNPGGTGKGIYVYSTSAWVKL